ncbi:MAG: hypothetical protein LBI79_07980 [Nitrososphaerota archaeon]|nr:hypothetical protein [Nitrososphaerota archaeon]
MEKGKAVELEVWVGKAARTNFAIFDTLSRESPQSLKQLQRHVCKYPGLEEIYYASLTKRLHCLEKKGYVQQVVSGSGGLKVRVYELRLKACLVMFLKHVSLQDILDVASDTQVACLLLVLLNVYSAKGFEG